MKRFNDSKITLVLLAFVALMLTAVSATADFTFGEPVNLGPVVNSSSLDIMCCITGDALEMYIFSNRPGGQGSWDLWVATRPTTDADWGPWQNLGPTVNTPSQEGSACISADGLSLYFPSDRPGGYGQLDIWVARRETKADKWGIPVNLGPTVNSGVAGYPDISADGLSLYFGSDRAGGLGGTDLWVTTRETTDDNWGPPANLGPTVNSTSRDADPSISSDGLVLFFDSERPGGYGPENLYMTRRATRNGPWGKPVNLGPPVDTSAGNGSSNVSADCRTLYFTSNRPGGYGSYDIWQAPIIPIVDFNGDRIVDLKDFSRLAQYWGQNEPSVDIAPMPWGDGRVDIQDVAVFAEHWLEGAAPIALWKLDETGGWTAHDNAGAHDGFVMSVSPLWRSTGGKVNGALELDGTDDYVNIPFVLDPGGGPFSVFAWVKGGAAGQVVISQKGGADWFCADPSAGKVMTRLMAPEPALQSESVITDGQWHEIGLVWDGSRRALYVDGVEVAKDTQDLVGVGSQGGLYIGAGKGLEAGSFWSGLIDDIKIYDRAVTP